MKTALNTKTIFVCVVMVLFTFKSYAQWNELGGTNALSANDGISTLTVDPSNNIYAAGLFTNSSGSYYVAKFNGTGWSELGGNNSLAATDEIKEIFSDKLGNIYALANFTNSNGNYYVAKWDGTKWSETGGIDALAANDKIHTICSDTAGNIYVAGKFTNGSSSFSGNNYVAKWDGTKWSELGGKYTSNIRGSIFSICSDAEGNIFAAGMLFDNSNKCYVAKWDGNTWSELGGPNSFGSKTTNFSINSICCDKEGNIYAAGLFANDFPFGNNYVNKWDKTSNTWSELGGKNTLGANSGIRKLFCDRSNNIYVLGAKDNTTDKAMKWDGKNWSELLFNETGKLNAISFDLANNIYVAGYVKNANGKYYVAKSSANLSVKDKYSSNKLNRSIQIFPNPTSSFISTKTNHQISCINLLNHTGQQIQNIRQIQGNECTLYLNQLAKGIYFIQVTDHDFTTTHKIIVE